MIGTDGPIIRGKRRESRRGRWWFSRGFLGPAALVVLGLGVGVVAAHAQFSMERLYEEAMNLFVEARFEQAVPLLEKVRAQAESDKVRLDAEALEAICLAVLHQKSRAEELVRAIYEAAPDYELKEEIRSPWVVLFFQTVKHQSHTMNEVEQWNEQITTLETLVDSGETKDLFKRIRSLKAGPWTNPAVKERAIRLANSPDLKTIEAKIRRVGEKTVRIEGITTRLGVGRHRRKVELTAYLIDRYPVTWQEYTRVLSEAGKRTPAVPAGKGNYPVVEVTWRDASIFCHLRGGDLPSEDQWEYAARGPSGLAFPFGRSFDPKRCNTRESGIGSTTPVDRYPKAKSPFGLWDMCGNVWEWTSTPVRQHYRVKGGSYREQAKKALTYSGDDFDPSAKRGDTGFRCVLPPTVVETWLSRVKEELERAKLEGS